MDGGQADVRGYVRIREGKIESRFTIQLRDVQVSPRRTSVDALVLGVPARVIREVPERDLLERWR